MTRTTGVVRTALTAHLAVWLLLSGASGPVLAGQADVSAQEVKAAMLFQFARFVEWPAGGGVGARSGPLVIGLLQADGVGWHLADLVKTQTIAGMPVVLKPMLSAGDPMDQIDLIFIGAAGRAQIPAVLQSIGSRAVLTVSDARDFVSLGGMVGFRDDRERIGFDINLASAEHANLRISSKLLSLARTVIRKSGDAQR
jgi:hypothetical protein